MNVQNELTFQIQFDTTYYAAMKLKRMGVCFSKLFVQTYEGTPASSTSAKSESASLAS